MSCAIIYNPETMTCTLTNGSDMVTLPNWAYTVIQDEVEIEIMPLKTKIEVLSDILLSCREENKRLRKLVRRMWPTFIGRERATFADRLHVRAEIEELGIEVNA